MKLPVNIDNLMEEWSTDSKIDQTEPGHELAKISSLHAKYLRIMTHHNLISKKLMTDYAKMKKLKWEYYSGDLNNPEDLSQYGFEPWVKKTLRQDIPMYIDSDTELNNILIKKMVHQEIVDFCESVLKELNNRTYQINGIIKWETFTSGG
jgi:hypothetical protein